MGGLMFPRKTCLFLSFPNVPHDGEQGRSSGSRGRGTPRRVTPPDITKRCEERQVGGSQRGPDLSRSGAVKEEVFLGFRGGAEKAEV